MLRIITFLKVFYLKEIFFNFSPHLEKLQVVIRYANLDIINLLFTLIYNYITLTVQIRMRIQI